MIYNKYKIKYTNLKAGAFSESKNKDLLKIFKTIRGIKQNINYNLECKEIIKLLDAMNKGKNILQYD